MFVKSRPKERDFFVFFQPCRGSKPWQGFSNLLKILTFQHCMKRTATILILLLGVMLFAQETNAQKELMKRANESIELLNTDPEKAFQEVKKIEKEAKEINAKEAELRAIRAQCEYYTIKMDFENIIVKAKSLFYKAGQYNFSIYRAIAKRYLFKAYLFSDLSDKAFQELEEGMKIINQLDLNDFSITVKGDLFIEYSNYYMLKADYINQLKYLRLAGREYEKVQDKRIKEIFLYINYSNLAGFYKDTEQQDSAKYYAKLSHSMDTIFGRNDIRYINLWVLGVVELKNQNYNTALHYLKQAEKLEGHKNHLNIEELYGDIITVYTKLQQEDSAKLYKVKKDALKFSISVSQNKSLHKLLKDKDSSGYKKYIYIFSFILIVTGAFLFLVIRKNRILRKQERASRQYLEKTSKNPSGADYSRLLEILKRNESTFMTYFTEVFPEFPSKIKVINPKISISDIEFCALLKLKIPTKDIAKYQFLEPQSVRNKKYRIRKKLHIPKEDNIYQFFEEL